MSDRTSEGRSRAWRVAFGVTLVYVMAISAYTQFALGVLGPLITDDLGLTRTQFGSLTTAIFVVGGLGAPLAGPLVDWLGGRRVLVLLFLVGGLSWAGMAAAPGYVWLLVAAALAGFVRGSSNPVGNQLIQLHGPAQRQGIIMGISKSGAQIGAFLVGVVVPFAAVTFGWRSVLGASVALAVLGLAATFLVIPPDRTRAQLREGADEVAGGVRSLVGWLAPHAFLIGFGTGSVSAYVPLFATERTGMSVAAAGAVISGMAITGIAGRILWGQQGDRFPSPQLPLVLIASFGVVSHGLLATAELGSQTLVWAGTLLFGATAGSWITVGMLAIIRETHVSKTGRASGLVLAMFYGGFSFSPLTFGFLVDTTDLYAVGWSSGAVSFALAALIAWRWHVARRRQPTPAAAT
ncbi:MFS transporter [Egibacter rhizosphaerae]|nr:MFS transporter [Egibacter rhizosphaerae]